MSFRQGALPSGLVFTEKSLLRREKEGFLYISSDSCFYVFKRLTEFDCKLRNGNQPAREAALSDVTATLKEPGFFVTSRCNLRL